MRFDRFGNPPKGGGVSSLPVQAGKLVERNDGFQRPDPKVHLHAYRSTNHSA